ncbi:MAG: succinyl-CoA--3-ketoacid-CoA transferase, partial [Chloroflexi bacterium]|nr:succinyl-CoA--3-ketoacid-CoA transferase [Chloroflexota bacterium]
SQNFNGVMATAANITIMEVDEVVEVGELDGHDIHTPGIYVNRVVEIKS